MTPYDLELLDSRSLKKNLVFIILPILLEKNLGIYNINFKLLKSLILLISLLKLYLQKLIPKEFLQRVC